MHQKTSRVASAVFAARCASCIPDLRTLKFVRTTFLRADLGQQGPGQQDCKGLHTHRSTTNKTPRRCMKGVGRLCVERGCAGWFCARQHSLHTTAGLERAARAVRTLHPANDTKTRRRYTAPRVGAQPAARASPVILRAGEHLRAGARVCLHAVICTARAYSQAQCRL